MSKTYRFKVRGRRVIVRLFSRYWKTKSHPYFYVRNYGTMVTAQVGPLEIFIRKPLRGGK